MDPIIHDYIEKLEQENTLKPYELSYLLTHRSDEAAKLLFEKARKQKREVYGEDIYIRGLIEFTNYCKNNCYYCGIRRENQKVSRYRLMEEDILFCCEEGYQIGFRTFVLQGGEDTFFTREKIVSIIRKIKEKFPDCAVTLSIGEWKREDYFAFREAGADRYLLRHETANQKHYEKLHPKNQTLKRRMQCLWDLKELGFQVGCGFMVGSPHQTVDCLVEDFLFLKQFQPHMVGIGPFLPHHETPFKKEASGDLSFTLYLLGIIRLLLPKVLLPATTALATIHPRGRQLGILAGANVVMPNLSPDEVRKSYLLYDNKICTKLKTREELETLKKELALVGSQVVIGRGDFIDK